VLAKRAEMPITLRTDRVPMEVPDDVGIAAYRIVQESLTNVVRHAEARSAAVDLRYDSGRLDIRVSDDGKGFEVDGSLDRFSAAGHAGLLGMRERVDSMGGEFKIRSAPGRGTEVQVQLPVKG